MSKTEEEACRHSQQCSRCKLWYCSDDQIMHCLLCIHQEDALCYKCLGVGYPWQTICQEHWDDILDGDDYDKERYVHRECNFCQQYFPTFRDITKDEVSMRICLKCDQNKQ